MTPSLSLSEGEWGASQIFYQYQNMKFYDDVVYPVLDRDGDQHTMGANQYIFLEAPIRYLRFGALYDRLRTQGSEYDYNGFEVSAGVGLTLPLDVHVTALYRFIHNHYRSQSRFWPRRIRDDNIQRFSLELTRAFGEHLELTLAGDGSLSDSDIAIFDYNRAVVGTYLTYTF